MLAQRLVAGHGQDGRYQRGDFHELPAERDRRLTEVEVAFRRLLEPFRSDSAPTLRRCPDDHVPAGVEKHRRREPVSSVDLENLSSRLVVDRGDGEGRPEVDSKCPFGWHGKNPL